MAGVFIKRLCEDTGSQREEGQLIIEVVTGVMGLQVKIAGSHQKPEGKEEFFSMPFKEEGGWAMCLLISGMRKPSRV